MTRASSLAFPGSRTLTAWWQQLAVYQPVSLVVGYFFVHCLEAPAVWRRERRLDPLALLVLGAVDLEQGRDRAESAVSSDRLQGRLRLDSGLIIRLTRTLRQENLLEAERSVGSHEAGFRVSELGREALRSGTMPTREWRREEFTFIESLGPTGERLAAPHFLRIASAPAAAWLPGAGTTLDVSCLPACLEQTSGWKTMFGFPQDVVAFPESAAASAVAPENVIIDRPQRVLAAVVETSEQEALVFGVRPEGWTLLAGEPIARLPMAAAKELGWERAAPVAGGDTWTLAGDGYMRQAARREMMPAPVGV